MMHSQQPSFLGARHVPFCLASGLLSSAQGNTLTIRFDIMYYTPVLPLRLDIDGTSTLIWKWMRFMRLFLVDFVITLWFALLAHKQVGHIMPELLKA